MLKKLLCLLLGLALLCPMGAMAEEETHAAATANAVVESANTYEVLAPCSGVLLPFTCKSGDAVQATDALFSMDTQKVYAPENGTLRAVFASTGQLCEDVIARYGMLASIEKDVPWIIEASRHGAHNSTVNMLIHMGERVYLKQSDDSDNKGEARIVAVNGSDYTLELTKGEFDIDEKVKIYRDDKLSTKACIGEGKVRRAQDVSVQGSGRVLKIYVSEGQRVTRGQLMYELVAADAASDLTTAEIAAGYDGALLEIKTAPGQQVYKGQALATVCDLTTLEVLAEVDEMDLGRLQVGTAVTIVLDRYPNEQINGAVLSIGRVGTAKQNAAYYQVKISFNAYVEALPGMNATVWLPETP
ncbi:MAG: HlyD family efflux transporter periplasmic adaptor subunit [Clostridia bacterium]